jgi:hypothetical protein
VVVAAEACSRENHSVMKARSGSSREAAVDDGRERPRHLGSETRAAGAVASEYRLEKSELPRRRRYGVH